ncbi:MAG: hypothetical protein SPE03_08130, partial [Treponema sp.]|nr:hypothetical protein [Treponema sp.]
NISPKLSARANYTFSGMTILQHEPAAAPKKVFLPCVSLPRANFYENIFYNAFDLGLSPFIVSNTIIFFILTVILLYLLL